MLSAPLPHPVGTGSTGSIHNYQPEGLPQHRLEVGGRGGGEHPLEEPPAQAGGVTLRGNQIHPSIPSLVNFTAHSCNLTYSVPFISDLPFFLSLPFFPRVSWFLLLT